MNKKIILLHICILGLLIGFVFIPITIYYLIPIGINVIEILNDNINELIGIIGR